MDKLWRNRDWLWEHYITRGESSYVMAKAAGCGATTIHRQLHRCGISVRGLSESIFLARKNSLILSPDLLEFLGGELVGDGYVGMMGNRSARYSRSSKYKNYLFWLSEQFTVLGLGQMGRIIGHVSKSHGAISYNYASKSYPELVSIRKRWYPDGKKVVPKDLKLTPIMARQWYLGDGGLNDYKIQHPGIRLSTCDFDKQSIDYLIKELQKQGFKVTYQPSGNLIYLSAYSVQDFLEWIGPCPISCYDYKWAI